MAHEAPKTTGNDALVPLSRARQLVLGADGRPSARARVLALGAVGALDVRLVAGRYVVTRASIDAYLARRAAGPGEALAAVAS